MYLKLIGVISPIYEPGTFKKCVPVFKDTRSQEYFILRHGKEERVNIENRTNNESFIKYKPSMNFTKARFIDYCREGDIIISTMQSLSTNIRQNLSVGILFPDKFVVVLSDVSEERLKSMI